MQHENTIPWSFKEQEDGKTIMAPSKVSIDTSLIDYSFKFEEMRNNSSNYGDHLIYLPNLLVGQSEETDFSDTYPGVYMTEMIALDSDGNIYYIFFIGNPFEKLLGKHVDVIGLPLGFSHFTNMNGETTETIVVSGSILAETTEANGTSWKKTYYDFIESEFYYLTSYMAKYYLFDVDNNGIPELYVETGSNADGATFCFLDGNSIKTYDIPYLDPWTSDFRDTVFYKPGTGHVWVIGNNQGRIISQLLHFSGGSIRVVGEAAEDFDSQGQVMDSSTFRWDNIAVDLDTFFANFDAYLSTLDGSWEPITNGVASYTRSEILSYFSN